MMGPYIGVYAVQLGATPAEMGWLQSLQQFSGSTMQLAWGWLMDRLGRPVLFVFVGGLIGGILLLPLLFVSSPQEIIIIAVLLGLGASMVGPSAPTVNNNLVPSSKRSQGVGEYHSLMTIGAIPATLLAGYLMSQTRGSLKAMYFLPIVMGATIRVGAAILLWPMMRREKRTAERGTQGLFENIGFILENSSLRIFFIISFFNGFFQSFPRTLFPIANVLITKNNMFFIGLLSITHTVISSLTRPYFGRLADRFGQRPFLVLGRTGMALTTLGYALATEPWHLIIANISWGIFAMEGTITQAYLLSHANPESIGTSLAFYSTVNSIAGVLGALASGYLVNELLSYGFAQTIALSIGFFVATGGRALTGITCLKLKEKHVDVKPTGT